MNKKRIFSEIIKKENFDVAIKNIKKNSKKALGIDKLNLNEFMNKANPYETILKRLENFKPNGVRRVDIPKGTSGKTRPLGIPTTEDKIIQMMFKNILEPICENNFNQYSYGFRPNRSAEHAIAWNNSLINLGKLHFCVDIDIKGFFDNINHKKLIKQCMTIEIKDMKVIRILKEMLKAPIHMPNGEVIIPTKGTPQGGILSPLLANICLNEMDWWISNQWQTLQTKRIYSKNSNRYRGLKQTKLTEVFLVRYADDFKLMCRTREGAEKMFKITKQFLKEKLKLNISKEKSQVINLRKKRSIFLGFEIKAVKKGKKVVANLWMSKKAKKKSAETLRNTIIEIQKNPNIDKAMKYNSRVRGMQNYYRIATHISISLSEVGFAISKAQYNRLKGIAKNNQKDDRYRERYKGYNYKTWSIKGITLFTIEAIKIKNPMMYSEGKVKALQGKKLITKETERVYENMSQGVNEEWHRIRAVLYHRQACKCYVTGEFLKHNEFASTPCNPKGIWREK